MIVSVNCLNKADSFFRVDFCRSKSGPVRSQVVKPCASYSDCATMANCYVSNGHVRVNGMILVMLHWSCLLPLMHLTSSHTTEGPKRNVPGQGVIVFEPADPIGPLNAKRASSRSDRFISEVLEHQ